MSTLVHQHVAPHDGRPCLCRICTCGHHPCPGIHKLTPLNAVSGYSQDYPGRQPDAKDRAVPVHRSSALQPTHAAPGHFLTTNQAAHEAGKDIPIEKTQSYKPLDTAGDMNPFAGDTTYHVDYPGHDPNLGQPIRATRPREALQRAPAVPGVFETTNQSANNAILQAYKDGTLQKSKSCKEPNRGPTTALPLIGNTSYRDDYVKHSLECPSTLRRVGDTSSLQSGPDNRDFLTTHGATYQRPPSDHAAKCPSCFVSQRPPSTDGHIKLTDVPDEYGYFVPATQYKPRTPYHK